jgi:hypothetical protein
MGQMRKLRKPNEILKKIPKAKFGSCCKKNRGKSLKFGECSIYQETQVLSCFFGVLRFTFDCCWSKSISKPDLEGMILRQLNEVHVLAHLFDIFKWYWRLLRPFLPISNAEKREDHWSDLSISGFALGFFARRQRSGDASVSARKCRRMVPI